MSFATITVTGTWTSPDGSVPTGWVLFFPEQSVTGGGYILADTPDPVELVNGSISVQLPSTVTFPTLEFTAIVRIVGAADSLYYFTPSADLDLSSLTPTA